MGKAALLIAFGATLFVAQGMLSQNETERHTAQTQAGFEEGVIAREIARTGFNVTMGKLREHGNNIHAAIAQINSHGANRYLEGESQGGTYRARVELKDGNTVRVTSVGYFGGEFVSLGSNEDPESGWCRHADPFSGDYYTGACHNMSDDSSPLYEYERPSGDPLTAKLECGRLDVEFLQSDAGYCSAVYLQRTLPDTTGTREPEAPEMLFLPGNNRDGTTLSTVSKYIRGGTQMNFFIGVDQNCSTQSLASTVDDFPEFTGSIDSPSPYDHLHYALMEEVGSLGEMVETPWAFTEMHPEGVQQQDGETIQLWRIGWEDQHITDWDNANSNDPRSSLQALKRLGYDGNGWPDADEHGYRELIDYPNRPDFSDQVVEVKLIEETDTSLCSPPPPTSPTTSTSPTPEPTVSCQCPGNQPAFKVAVYHKLPNQKRGRTICIAPAAVEHHLNQHEDHILCEGS
jgi:hypothetical protein